MVQDTTPSILLESVMVVVQKIAVECQNIHTDKNIIINHTTDTKDDDSLVILAKQTTLTDSQKKYS